MKISTLNDSSTRKLRPNLETQDLPDSNRKLISDDLDIVPIKPDDPKFDALRNRLKNAKRSSNVGMQKALARLHAFNIASTFATKEPTKDFDADFLKEEPESEEQAQQ